MCVFFWIAGCSYMYLFIYSSTSIFGYELSEIYLLVTWSSSDPLITPVARPQLFSKSSPPQRTTRNAERCNQKKPRSTLHHCFYSQVFAQFFQHLPAPGSKNTENKQVFGWFPGSLVPWFPRWLVEIAPRARLVPLARSIHRGRLEVAVRR